jgi:hypothetical protein
LIDTKTADDVIVDQADGLHIGIANNRAYEGESEPLQILAEPVRNR